MAVTKHEVDTAKRRLRQTEGLLERYPEDTKLQEDWNDARTEFWTLDGELQKQEQDNARRADPEEVGRDVRSRLQNQPEHIARNLLASDQYMASIWKLMGGDPAPQTRLSPTKFVDTKDGSIAFAPETNRDTAAEDTDAITGGLHYQPVVHCPRGERTVIMQSGALDSHALNRELLTTKNLREVENLLGMTAKTIEGRLAMESTEAGNISQTNYYERFIPYYREGSAFLDDNLVRYFRRAGYREELVGVQAGTLTNVTKSRQEGNAPTEGKVPTKQKRFKAYKAAGLVKITDEYLDTAQVNDWYGEIEMILGEEIAYAAGEGVEAGTGTNEPTGILTQISANANNIQTVPKDASGALQVTSDHLLTAGMEVSRRYRNRMNPLSFVMDSGLSTKIYQATGATRHIAHPNTDNMAFVSAPGEGMIPGVKLGWADVDYIIGSFPVYSATHFPSVTTASSTFATCGAHKLIGVRLGDLVIGQNPNVDWTEWTQAIRGQLVYDILLLQDGLTTGVKGPLTVLKTTA